MSEVFIYGITWQKNRILDIFFRLLRGDFVSVKQLADEYSVTGKTVSRDINEIKSYLSENGFRNKNAQIIYSDKERAYYLSIDDFLSSKELQANVGEFSSSAGTNYMGSHGLISIIFIVAVCVLTVIGKKYLHWHLQQLIS